MINKLITDDNYLNIYRFGSLVYGTNNKLSDEDLICVVKEKIERPNINIHIYTEKEFQTFLDNHEIQALECYFLSDLRMTPDKNLESFTTLKLILKETVKFDFKLDKQKLRKSISTTSNGSWIKGKKKLTVQADYNRLLGIKSIFHAIRILGFGIQIAQYGKITDYSQYNWYWEDILYYSKGAEDYELWDILDYQYKEFFLNMKKEFAKLCPLGYDKNDIKKEKLIELLNSYNITDIDTLSDQIFEIFIKNK